MQSGSQADARVLVKMNRMCVRLDSCHTPLDGPDPTAVPDRRRCAASLTPLLVDFDFGFALNLRLDLRL